MDWTIRRNKMSTTLSSVKPVLFQERKFYIDNPMSMEEVLSIVKKSYRNKRGVSHTT